MAKTKRTSAAYEAMKGFQDLLEVFESLKHAPEPSGGLTMSSWRRGNERMAKKIAGGVSRLQDALWKGGLDCRCAQPQKKRSLEWVCSCKTRPKGSRRRG